jgi:hypothetical protein
VPRRWLAGVSILLVLPWLVAGAVYISGSDEPRRTVVPSEPPSDPPTESAVGPWGRLTRTPIVISPPVEYVARNWGEPSPLLWHLPVASTGEVAPFLSAAGVSAPDVAMLASTARLHARGGVVLTADADLARGLPRDVRARLYLQMARSPIARDEHSAFRFHGPTLEAWLGPRVSNATLEMIRPFVFRHADFMYFADIDAVWPRIEDPDELQRLARALNRQATLLVTLRVEDVADVSALAEYWGRRGRRTDIRPLLESVVDGVHPGIDISHLLPTLPRSLLYRYPRLTVADHEQPVLPNCLWTALNFFNVEPDDRFLDVSFAMETLRRDYVPIRGEPSLGDIVAFSDRDANLFHAAVYVADGLVFGKNGIAPLSPWSILPLERMKGHYVEFSDGWQVLFFRRRDLT